MNHSCDFGLIGLAVMGENLALNVESRGYKVAVFNRTTEKVDEFIRGRAAGKNFVGCHSVEEVVKNLARPRKVMMLVKAGKPVDEFIEQLIPHLSPGDIIIDGGNSLFNDTNRRVKYCESKGLLFVGTGVSGGEEGALEGVALHAELELRVRGLVAGDLEAAFTWSGYAAAKAPVFGVFGSFTYYLPELFPTRLRATGAGFCYNIGRIASACGVIFSGTLSSGGDFKKTLIFASVLFLPGLFVALLLPEPGDAGIALHVD